VTVARRRPRYWRYVCALAACVLATAAAAQGRLPRAPFITTPDEVVERMLALAGTGADDFVIDLGSGDGRIVIAAAAKFGAKGMGVDLDANLVAQSRENARQAGVAERARFEQRNAFGTDLSRATVVTIYLLPQVIDWLQPKLLAQLQPGARVVTHAFGMKGWKPDRAETVRLTRPHPGQGDESRIYLWIVPAQARGEWQAGDLRLRIRQNFQEIQVEGQLQGRALRVTQAKLEGALLSFAGDDFSYRGRVASDRIDGEITRDGVAAPLVLEKR
jgi:hypothetical protein